MGWEVACSNRFFYASNERKIRKNIVCLTGEGGLQMNIPELATILHHKIL